MIVELRISGHRHTPKPVIQSLEERWKRFPGYFSHDFQHIQMETR